MINALSHAAIRRAAPLCCASIVVIGVVAGCSESPESAPSSQPPKVLSTSEPENALNLSLPIEPYLYSMKDLHRLKEAEGSLIEDCMKGFGFQYVAPESSLESTGVRSRTDRRYGIADGKMAATYGYHLGENDPRSAAAAVPTAGAPARPSAAMALVLMGGTGPLPDKDLGKVSEAKRTYQGKKIPAGGCTGKARADLVGKGSYGDPELSRNIKAESFDRSLEDSRTKAVFRTWSECMKAGGYSYKAPLDAPGDDPRFNGPKASREEIVMAVKDVSCKKKTNLVGVWFSVESAYQKQIIEKNQEALVQISKEKGDTLKKISKLTTRS